MRNRYLLDLSLLVFLFTSAHAEAQKYITFKIDVYKNPNCTGKLAGSAVTIDTSKSCNSYSYVDSKGITTTGAQNHMRCYKDKVIFDKYPFSGKCLASESLYQGKQFVEKNHSIQIDVCQKTASHDGPVYEKLSGYIYPGNENCRISFLKK